MRQIRKFKKTGIFRKILIKFCRLLGYELIDQADMSFVTSLDSNNASIIGKKSITLPMGEVKIKRKIKSLDIILKTCTSVNLVTQNKKRIFEQNKSEYTFRTMNSILKSLKKANENTENIKFKITIINTGSSKKDTEQIKEMMNNSNFEFNLINLDLKNYTGRIKIIKKNNNQIEENMKSTMASIIKSIEISKKANDLVYFVEDDYLHNVDSILEMISAYEKFSTILEDEIFIVPVDYPYLYQKNQEANILIGQKYHWRSVKSLC